MKPLSGNVSDPGSFPELIERHVDHLQNAQGFDYVVADSSLYSADHVEKLTEGGVKFVTRVPGTISEAKTRIQEAEIESMDSLTEGYRGEEYRSKYGGVEQRWLVVYWLVVYSEEAEDRARDNAREQLRREHEKEAKAFSELTGREFACREDAEKALEEFEADLKASEFTEKQKNRSSEPPATRWKSPPRPAEKATGSKRPAR